MQKRQNSSVLAMALCLFCIKPSIFLTLNSQKNTHISTHWPHGSGMLFENAALFSVILEK